MIPIFKQLVSYTCLNSLSLHSLTVFTLQTLLVFGFAQFDLIMIKSLACFVKVN
jgi:hypothetical protein